MSRKLLFNMLIVALFLGAGLLLGPLLRNGYARLFPEPEFVIGDYAGIYRAAGKPVVMYATSTCPNCRHARALFSREGVDYREFEIDKSPAARRQFEALDGEGVPLLFIGDRRIAGYREKTILDSLASMRR